MPRMRAPLALLLALLLSAPLIGSIHPPIASPYSNMEGGMDGQLIHEDWTTEIPVHSPLVWNQGPWWTWTTLDSDRNGIHDSLQDETGIVWIGLSYDHTPTDEDQALLTSLGFNVKLLVPAVDAILIGAVNASDIATLAEIEGIVMVERYGTLVFYGDIQTPAVKARNSTEYPLGAWELGVSGYGVNIALTDTGVDSEHPGLEGKHVAGFDSVCYLHTDVPRCILAGAGARQDDGSFDPDDGNQHGTACMGMAAATGIGPDGQQTDYYGSAPNASLVDVRIGTDVGAGPFENYLTEQEAYESAMNGLQWIIDNKDTAWPGVDEALHGIDIISLSWGITSHEGGGSDGNDMHSRILDEATEAGVTVSNAAGNDGEDNDGLSGMSASSLSITVGATDDKNTIDRDDDTVAGYSSRGPRRDNGDGNPVNELIPEISAPGTNIIQAEGCVTSGGCNNNVPGQDASENTYTGRGSGTSYATPSVTGVIALVIEANPDLNPMQIKEVLKQTAERRGPASAPDVDPYWNRDFGYGMVDARAAVELALHLKETNQSTSIDWTIQNHILNVTNDGRKVIISGHAWTQSDIIEMVEFRVGTGPWSEATYEAEFAELGPLTPFNWTVALDTSKLEGGNQTIEIRASRGAVHSVPSSVVVMGEGSSKATSMSMVVVVGGGLLLAGILAGMFVLIMNRLGDSDQFEEIFEAEILDDVDYDSMTVKELKEELASRDLPVSGKKEDLIARLRS
ncbi:MAG: S8 family serine peptidase [Candidatus Thermoplasmatota archaeon]|nr:S8 family serine peptidase [Candidatus Thermoplasmatota archaeon]